MESEKKYTVHVRIWVDEKSGPFLGHGRVILLERIRETGSIRRAAESMKMSYRQAWQMIEDMNRRSALPLVEKHLGGKSGGGTQLTPTGERVVSRFRELEKDIQSFANGAFLQEGL